jgi:hypothetical protein
MQGEALKARRGVFGSPPPGGSSFMPTQRRRLPESRAKPARAEQYLAVLVVHSRVLAAARRARLRPDQQHKDDHGCHDADHDQRLPGRHHDPFSLRRGQHRTLDRVRLETSSRGTCVPEDALGDQVSAAAACPCFTALHSYQVGPDQTSPPNHWEHPPPTPKGHRCPRRSTVSNSWQARTSAAARAPPLIE